MTSTEHTATIANTGNQLARRAMIDSQLRPSGVNEPWVLAAMASLPREDYVPEAARPLAYIDRAVPLGDGRFLAPPLAHGRMLAEAAPTTADHALLVSSGSEYLAALLRPLVGSLTVVDASSVANGVPGGSYSLIVIDGAIEVLPDALANALADGGRIVSGLVERGVTRLGSGRKAAGAVALIAIADIGIPVLAEFAAPRRWSF